MHFSPLPPSNSSPETLAKFLQNSTPPYDITLKIYHQQNSETKDLALRTYFNRYLIHRGLRILPWSNNQLDRITRQLFANNSSWKKQIEEASPEALIITSQLCTLEDFAGATNLANRKKNQIKQKIITSIDFPKGSQQKELAEIYRIISKQALHRLKTQTAAIAKVVQRSSSF